MQKLNNFLAICKPVNLGFNEREQLKNMEKDGAYYYGPYIQFFVGNQLYVTRTTDFSKTMLEEFGYKLYNTSEISVSVPVYNFSTTDSDVRVIDTFVSNYVADRVTLIMRQMGTNQSNVPITFEDIRNSVVNDPSFKDELYRALLNNDDLRYVCAFNGDPIFNKQPEASSYLSQIIGLDDTSFKQNLSNNSSYLYFTGAQRSNSKYTKFFEETIIPIVDAKLDTYNNNNSKKM